MRLIITILIFSLALTGKAQNLIVKSFRTSDSILLRWAPSSAEEFKIGLEFGYKIERVEGSSFEGNNAIKEFSFDPALFRMEDLMKGSDSAKAKYAAVVNAFLDEEDNETMAFSYAALSISAGADAKLAEVLGLRLVDDGVEKGKPYSYRISIWNKNHNGVLSGGALHQTQADLSTFVEINTLQAHPQSKQKQILLRWNAKELEQEYCAYWIERSENGGAYIPINKDPFYFLTSADEKNKKWLDYLDQNIARNVDYNYRVIGISHLALKGETSNVVKARIGDILTGIVKMDTIYNAENKRVISGSYENHSKIIPKEYILLKSNKRDGNYTVLSTNAKPLFEIKDKDNRVYYKLAAISSGNDTLYSFSKYFFEFDQVPPTKPAGLAGIIDSNGVVKLSWTDNEEPDLKGYRIFRSNAKHEEFVEITNNFVLTESFLDTLALDNLTSEVFYKISAVDQNFNNSDYSEILELMKPDTIAPAACVLISYNSSKHGVKLRWNNSSSFDIATNYLIRNMDTVLTWTDTISACLDSIVEVGSAHTYYVITVDKSGNESRSEELNLMHETGSRPGLSGLKYDVDREDHNIKLSWDQATEKIYDIRIYRLKNDGKYRLVKTLRDQYRTEYIDRDLSISNIYKYKVKVMYQSGISSDFSQELVVKY